MAIIVTLPSRVSSPLTVLFLTHRLPYAPNRGDRIRAYYIVQELRSQVNLRIASLVHSDQEEAEAERMRADGLHVDTRRVPRLKNYLRAGVSLLGEQPLTHVLLHADGFQRLLAENAHDRPPDVVLAFCSGMARFALQPPLDRFPLVIDLVDVDSAKWAELAGRSRWPMRWIYRREATHLSAFERQSVARAVSTLIVNEREAETLKTIAPGAAIAVVPNGIDLRRFTPSTPPAAAARVVFCGVMNYAPNIEGVLWFAREVWPRIRAVRSDAVFSVVGADPSPAIRELAANGSGIEVTGTVARVETHLWSAAVSVAPLRIARGLQNKVLEALAAGLPTVVTRQVAEGLPMDAMHGCVVADLPAAFADATLALLGADAATRRNIAQRAKLDHLTWTHQLASLLGILEHAARTPAR